MDLGGVYRLCNLIGFLGRRELTSKISCKSSGLSDPDLGSLRPLGSYNQKALIQILGRSTHEPLSKLLVSPVISPVVVPYAIP